MPELPEVESIKVQLARFLIGHGVREVDINYQKTFRGEVRYIEGSKIINIRRYGKVLVIDLDNGYSVVIHVKMTGQLIYRGPNLSSFIKLSDKVKGGIDGKHTHVVFHLDRGGELYFVDYRKFGWIDTVKSSKLKDIDFLGKLGKEFSISGVSQSQDGLTLGDFRAIIRKSKRPIKILIMDQAKMSGVGNIYANDALWLSRIDPRRSSEGLDGKEIKTLFDSIIKVLKKGIQKGGASELAFVTPDGKEGNYQDFTLVYGREGKACKKCSTKIKKIKLGGRGTYYCSVCQK